MGKSKIEIVSMSFPSDFTWERASFDYEEINNHPNPKELIQQVVDKSQDPYCGWSKITNKYIAYNILLQLNMLARRPNPNKFDYGVLFDRKRGKFSSFYKGETTPISDTYITQEGEEPPENWPDDSAVNFEIKEIRPVHYVNDILDDNALCGEYTWKQGMSCTMNIFDVTCGCCSDKFRDQKLKAKCVVCGLTDHVYKNTADCAHRLQIEIDAGRRPYPDGGCECGSCKKIEESWLDPIFPHTGRPKDHDTYEGRLWAYTAAYKLRLPCDLCSKVHPKHHHATCFGKNLCHDCYLKEKPCTQVYPGDAGGSIMPFGLSKNDPEMVKDICKQETWRDRKPLL